MKIKTIKTKLIVALSAVFCTALVAGICSAENTLASADTDGYNESYRNQLAYSAKSGWNNDPNGLLYVNGTYHMYYQYNWNSTNNTTAPGWGHMSWGHATSTDLVHWTEHSTVAIPSFWDEGHAGEDAHEHMIFSGSAVYDEHNSSGFFDGNGGIVAFFTESYPGAGGQRQRIAYSTDGTTFTVGDVILDIDAEGTLGDGEFRDPKVFWNEKLQKWLMAVGGGAVRMYASENLTEWKYIGNTGFWGECPDISRYEVDGVEKYALIISPEDKNKSHEYNGTDRTDTYYPAEYYVIGDLDENGLFRGTQPIKRLSEGIDSYAFQSFNNVENGKVYGVSWSASWLTAGAYEGFRDRTHNGGMTVVTELNLKKDGEGYSILRTPVEGVSSLRGTQIADITGKASKDNDPLSSVKAREADMEITLDFSGSSATYAELSLRKSPAESIIIKYDKASETLSLDRSQSSLLAKNTNFYKDVYSHKVPLENGRLSLRILLDRAFISMFANGGEASYFSAVFPSAISDGMSLVADGEIAVDAHIYAVSSIFGSVQTRDGLVITTDKIDMTVGSTQAVIGSSFGSGFDISNVNYSLEYGADIVDLKVENGIAYITAKAKGSAKLKTSYNGQNKFTEFYTYNNGFVSDVNYTDSYRAFTYLREDGLVIASDPDAFVFGDYAGEDFTYSATFYPQMREKDGIQQISQAGGIAFGYKGLASGYWFATADLKEHAIKLVQFRGEKEPADTLASATCALSASNPYRLAVKISGGRVAVYVNNNPAPIIEQTLGKYTGGRVGLNVFNAEMVVNGVRVAETDEISGAVNVTDGSYRLKDGDYTVENGQIKLTDGYLKTLEAGAEYRFRVFTALLDYDIVIKADFEGAKVQTLESGYARGEDISFNLSEGAQVLRLEIDGEELEYSVDGTTIKISAENAEKLTSGQHTLRVYTSNGRASATFNLSGLPDYQEDYTEAVSHAFFWVDIAIFGALIVGYATFAIVKKFKKK